MAIIIFCRHPEYHRSWSSKFTKVIKIVNSGFTEVLLNLHSYFRDYVSSYIFSSIDSNELELITQVMQTYQGNNVLRPQDENPRNYLHFSKDWAIQFSLVIDKLLKRKKDNHPNVQLIQEELMNLANSTVDKENIKNRINNTETLFQNIILTYTTNEIYQNFNNCFATNNYDKILETLVYCFSCVFDSKFTANKQLEPNENLYRGIANIPMTEYVCNKTMFWKAFTSTSVDSKTAEKFATENEGILFEIRLSKKCPHPHLKIDNSAIPRGKGSPFMAQFRFSFCIFQHQRIKWKFL